jgi:hypothetical protein
LRHPPEVAPLDQRNVARAVVVVLGNKKKLEAGFVATRWGRFDTRSLCSAALMAAVVSGQKAPVKISELPRSFDSGKGKRRMASRSNDIEQRRGLLMAAAVPQVFMLSLKSD